MHGGVASQQAIASWQRQRNHQLAVLISWYVLESSSENVREILVKYLSQLLSRHALVYSRNIRVAFYNILTLFRKEKPESEVRDIV